MLPEVVPLHQILALDTDLVRNAVGDLTEEEARRRPVAGANSISFLLVHLVDARHFLATLLGEPVENPLAEAFADVASIEEAGDLFPPMVELRAMWGAIGAHLEAVLATVDAERLARPAGQEFPVPDESVLAGVSFLLHHESYHVGQIGLLRKALGRPALTYDRLEEGEA